MSDDLIKRSDAIEVAYQLRHKPNDDEWNWWLRSFNAIPTIDIVRCRECKHRKKNCFCLEHNRYEKNDNGYCSYGEREGE